jgi:hypothetical protein
MVCLTAAASSLDTPYPDLSGHQNYSEDSEYSSTLWSTAEQTSLTNPLAQQSFPLQRDTYSGHMGTPVPLYSVPATHLAVTSGASGSSVAVTGTPGGRVGEDMLRTHPAFGETRQPAWVPWWVESI